MEASDVHATLQRRETPETVAGLIDRGLPLIAYFRLKRPLRAAVRSSIRSCFGWSSMPADFHRPVPMTRQLDKARELALAFLNERLPESSDPDAAADLIDALNRLIGKEPGHRSFLNDRRNGAAREEAGLTLSRRRYTRLFRLSNRLERRLAKLRDEEAKFRLVLVSKAAFAPDLTLEDLGGHLPTAAFIAYYSARLKLRSVFTNEAQQRPFDEICAALLAWCERGPGTRWFAIAHVFPRADVLERLSEHERGHLLGKSFDVLQELADRLDTLHKTQSIDLDSMIVRRGNDSSTWNTLAGAWNRARDHWIALVDAMGMHALFDIMLPGKVMRLMAADVAAWHRASGGEVHPDTLVWRELPKPWEVLRGEAGCTRSDIEAACQRHRLKSGNGWAAPRPRTAVAAFTPTPELVHGVVVNNPYLAKMLREADVFSGRPANVVKLRGADD